jgi:ribosomal protein S18 acetylase RimI-like enzyme
MTNKSLSSWDQEAESWANRMVIGDYKGLRGAFDISQSLICGFMGYWQLISQGNCTYVGLAVVSNLRGKGYGRVGFALVNEFASDIGISPLYLEVLESNSSAIHIYLENGYHIVSSAKRVVYGQTCNVLTMRS